MKKPKVSLVNFTKDPIETMCWARRVMHSNVPDSLEDIKIEPEKWLGLPLDEYVDDVLMKDGMPTFLEYVSVTFKLENVSRALQQQLTRHRIGFSYSIQSLRCVELPKFAENFDYYNPYLEGTKEFEEYHKGMIDAQNIYNKFINAEMPTQDARGILPMNVYSTVTFSCSLRALIGMLNKRLCLKTQGEFREVAFLMMKEISTKMDKRILNWVGPPCQFGRCMMKGENEAQLKQNKLKGKQNTDHVCPNYIRLFVNEKTTK